MIGMVIVNYNDYRTTKRLLDNVKNYKILKEIVVVDNKSTDDSLENLQKLKNKKITIIDSGENKGYSYALNVGCKYLITKYKELMKAAVKKYNDAVKEFNQHTTDDEAAKAQFEVAKQGKRGTNWNNSSGGNENGTK